MINDLFEDSFKWLGVEQVIAEVFISSILVANTVDIDVETINVFLSSVTFHLSYLPGVFSVNPTKISRNSHFFVSFLYFYMITFLNFFMSFFL